MEDDWNSKVYAKSKTKMIPKTIRDAVRERDNNRCQVIVCHANKSLSCHHIIPRNCNGLDVEENLVLLCERCHNEIEELDLRTLSEIRKYVPDVYANQVIPENKIPAIDDWHTWVYGGTRNPNA